MMKDYKPVLGGAGATDYARYMRTDTLLSLQVSPREMRHRDELLFQIVHQSTELWLKLACNELRDAAVHLRQREMHNVLPLVGRSTLAVQLVTDQLEMLTHMTPWDFYLVRPALGNGSGFESPGWRAVNETGNELSAAFDHVIAADNIDLVRLYKEQRHSPLFSVSEALVGWDEKVALWRARHYKVAVRTIGINTVGTKGTPVDKLTLLLGHQFFPSLWRVRSTLFASSSNG
jgi:tryptophan 2,3-dioxygenase